MPNNEKNAEPAVRDAQSTAARHSDTLKNT